MVNYSDSHMHSINQYLMHTIEEHNNILSSAL